MTEIIARRFAMMILIMICVSILLFVVNEGDPRAVAVGVLGPFATVEQQDLWITANGFDRPMLERYFSWVSRLMEGDLGHSVQYKTPVADFFWSRLANTGLLALLALGTMVPLALLLGVLSGMREGSWGDRVISVISIITTSIPEYASAVLLSLVFVFWLGWLPGTSMSGVFDPLSLILPVLVLVMYGFGYITRMTRASMAEVMHSQYIRTAYLKGVSSRHVVFKHALRNAMIAPFTVIMLQLNWLLSGVVVTEFAFSYKGFGAMLLDASLNRDIYVLEACGLAAVFIAVLSQALADIGYIYLNPRIRYKT